MNVNELDAKQMESVAGGSGDQAEKYPNCPKCGSSNVRFIYDHDEIGVFQCNDCHYQFSNTYGG